jgi:hypothetical protein
MAPELLVSRVRTNWYIELDFQPLQEFPRRTWLKVTNVVGATLNFYSTNGQELLSINPDVLMASKLPHQTAVSNVMRGVNRRWRGAQWLETYQGSTVPAAGFDVHSALGRVFTNDLTLRIRPLLYQVDRSGTSAKLVEFPAVTLELLSDGEVRDVTKERP